MGSLFNAGCHGYGLGILCFQNRVGRNAPYTVFLQQCAYRAWADAGAIAGVGTRSQRARIQALYTALKPEKLGEVAPQVHNLEIHRTEQAQAVWIGAKCTGEYADIPAIIFGPRWRQTVPKAIELLRID